MKLSRLCFLLLAFILLCQGLAIAQEPGFPGPVMKSLILPGWGERSQESRNRGLLFTGLETALWTFSGLSLMNSRQYDDDLRYFAANHAGVLGADEKNDKYLDALADYESMTAYNAQTLRNRRNTELYSAERGEDWEWDSDENRLEYQNIKLDRYHWNKYLEYTLGVIALNHLVSAMDALYLQRMSERMSLLPDVQPGQTGVTLVVKF